MNTKRIIGLGFRACGLVAIAIGAVLISNWLLVEFSPGPNSGPHRIVGAVGIASALAGIACRLVVRLLLRVGSAHS